MKHTKAFKALIIPLITLAVMLFAGCGKTTAKPQSTAKTTTTTAAVTEQTQTEKLTTTEPVTETEEVTTAEEVTAESTTTEPEEPETETETTTTAAETTTTVTEPEPEETEQTREYVEYRFRNKKLLNQHYEKHGKEMGFASAADYEAAASDVINSPDALFKYEKEDGDGVYYIEETNEFAILSTDGYIRTYFEPGGGRKYFDRQ